MNAQIHDYGFTDIDLEQTAVGKNSYRVRYKGIVIGQVFHDNRGWRCRSPHSAKTGGSYTTRRDAINALKGLFLAPQAPA